MFGWIYKNKMFEVVETLVKVGLEAIEADKERAAASLLGLPVCFEYGALGPKAYAKPDLNATVEYLRHLRAIWLPIHKTHKTEVSA